MRLGLIAALVFGLLALAPSAYAQTRIVDFPAGDAERNRIDQGMATIRTPWRETADLSEQTRVEFVLLQVLVDESGATVDAVAISGPAALFEAARLRAMAMHYHPFTAEGAVVRARFNVSIAALPEDYRGPADRSFPAKAGDDLVIRLVRSACYGTCPNYELEISGNGEVRYVGHEHVAQEGEHRWTIPPERVAELVAIFRRADYFNLRGYYVIPAFHLPLYVTSIRIGEQEKFVFDYGSSLLQGSLGGARSSTLGPGISAEDIAPASVAEVENAIDRIAGVGPYVGARDE